MDVDRKVELGNITVTIPAHGDTFLLEQQSGTGPSDIVSIWSLEDAEKIANLLLEWVAKSE